MICNAQTKNPGACCFLFDSPKSTRKKTAPGPCWGAWSGCLRAEAGKSIGMPIRSPGGRMMYTISFPVPCSRTHACFYLSWPIRPRTAFIANFWFRARYCGIDTSCTAVTSRPCSCFIVHDHGSGQTGRSCTVSSLEPECLKRGRSRSVRFSNPGCRPKHPFVSDHLIDASREGK